MHFQITNTKTFWLKIALLSVFSLAYLPLASLKQQLPWQIYLAILIAIHVYFFIVLFTKISWRELKTTNSGLITRIAMVSVLTLALIFLGDSPLRHELITFLSFSFALHVLLVASLHLKVARKKITAYHKSPVKS